MPTAKQLANLKSNEERTPKERRENARKAGIASGKARRKLKTLREELTILLASNDNQSKISLALIKKALKGDTKAFEIIRDTLGQKPVEQVEVKEVDTDWFLD